MILKYLDVVKFNRRMPKSFEDKGKKKMSNFAI